MGTSGINYSSLLPALGMDTSSEESVPSYLTSGDGQRSDTPSIFGPSKNWDK